MFLTFPALPYPAVLGTEHCTVRPSLFLYTSPIAHYAITLDSPGGPDLASLDYLLIYWRPAHVTGMPAWRIEIESSDIVARVSHCSRKNNPNVVNLRPSERAI